jgi:hypothetical protein
MPDDAAAGETAPLPRTLADKVNWLIDRAPRRSRALLQ